MSETATSPNHVTKSPSVFEQWVNSLISPYVLAACLIVTGLALLSGIVMVFVTQPGLLQGEGSLLPIFFFLSPALGLGVLTFFLFLALMAKSGQGNGQTPQAPHKNKRSWFRSLGYFVENNTLWVILGTLLSMFVFVTLVAYFVSAQALNALLLIGSVAIALSVQILTLAFGIVMQFGILFWFMGRSRIEVINPGDPKSLTLTDYKGQKQLVKLVKQWISLLSDREEFTKMGGNYINGLLLYGPPGTGKTMLAKCMAGEAGVAFMSTEGSSFRGMFFGMDVLKVMSFCGKAKRLARQYGACIAYIDEIDAVGASRGGVMGGMGGGMGGGMFGGMGGGALTRLLYEIDGITEQTRLEKLTARLYKFFGKKRPERDWHVLYMGSTNRPDVLDPALTRPGRFDRSLSVEVPDKTGRREIVQYYLNKIAHDDTVDLEAIVSDTNGATPARIMSAITKDAVRIALFAGRNKVSQRDIDLAFQEQYFGIENPIEEIEEDQQRVLAYHEAGHSIAQHYLMPDQRIVRVSIIRRGGAFGYMLPVDAKEWHIIPLRRYILDIMVSLAGRASEIVFFGERFNSVGGDYANIRWNIWVLYNAGMFGPPTQGQGLVSAGTPGGVNFSQGDRDRIVEHYWKTLEAQVEQLLHEHAAEVHAVANALLERSDLSNIEFLEIIKKVRAEAMVQGQQVPEGLPPMAITLLPEYQDVLAPVDGNGSRAQLPGMTTVLIQSGNGNGHTPSDDPLTDTQPNRVVRPPAKTNGETPSPITGSKSNGDSGPASATPESDTEQGEAETTDPVQG